MTQRCDCFLLRLVLLVLVASVSGGCGFDPLPKMRVGSAPYPRPNSFLAALDPEDLGPHRYDSFIPYLDREKSRGIVYTCRGGFIDLSHARHVSDWSRYLALRFRHSLHRQDDHFRVAGTDHSTVEVRLHYPPWWDDLPPDERNELIDALALRLGQKTAYALQTYHEAQTWYGYRYIPLFDEWDSAFCYDDMVSHLVGVRTAGAALQDGRALDLSRSDYNRAMETAYAAEMKRLEAVPPKRTWAAVRYLEEKWWGDEVPVKRQVDAGYGDNLLEAWLIPGFECDHDHRATGGGPEPFLFALPTLEDVHGRDMTGFADLYIRPGLFQRGRMVKAIGERGRKMHIDYDFPRLIQAAAADARARLGEEAVSPPVAPADQSPPATAMILPATGGDPIPATRPTGPPAGQPSASAE